MLIKKFISFLALLCGVRGVTLSFYSKKGCISCCSVQCGDLEPDVCCDASFNNHDIWEAADLSTYHGGTGLFFTLQTWSTQLSNPNPCAVFLTRGSGCQEASTIQSGSYFQTQDGLIADNSTTKRSAARECRKADIYVIKDNGTQYELDYLDSENIVEIGRFHISGDLGALVEHAKMKALRITAIDTV